MTNDWVFTATSAPRRRVLEVAQIVARSECPVLITGPTGIGKDVLAEDIHRHSTRSHRRFVAVNCAAITPTLFESEFFGHHRGAYTGATSDKEGLFDVADGGTLFLDEIGELALEQQAKLLRVLERGTFRRVGALQERTTDVRIIAATNRDLWTTLHKSFREDLFYRLSVVTIHVPPLHSEDVHAIVHVLVEHLGKQRSHSLPQEETEALAALAQRQVFHGGVRDLRNTLERYLLLRGRYRSMEETWRATFDLGPQRKEPSFVPLPRPDASIVRLVEDMVFLLSVREARSVQGAATLLHVSLPTVYSRLKRLRIPPEHVGRLEVVDAALAALQRAAREHQGALQTVLKTLLES